MILLGIDTGGTFTDFIYREDASRKIHKTLSTPDNPALAVLTGLRRIAGARNVQVVHGSTVATNALLERKGAPTALITNAGFEDVLVIGRQNREALYRLSSQKTPPWFPKTGDSASTAGSMPPGPSPNCQANFTAGSSQGM